MNPELKLESGYWQASRRTAALYFRKLVAEGTPPDEDLTNLLAIVMVPGCDFDDCSLREIHMTLLENSNRVLGLSR